jgi:cytochrome c-type biogenesis protein CcmH/NrfG
MLRKTRIILSAMIVSALLIFVAIGDWLSSREQGHDSDSSLSGMGGVSTLAALEDRARNEPAKAVNFIRLGDAYKASGRLGEAVSAYVSAAELAPGNTEVQRALISLKAMAEAKGRH